MFARLTGSGTGENVAVIGADWRRMLGASPLGEGRTYILSVGRSVEF